MKKSAPSGHRLLTDFFKPKTTSATESRTIVTSRPPAKKARTEVDDGPPLPSPTASPAAPAAPTEPSVSQGDSNNVGAEPANNANVSFASIHSTSSRRVVTSSGQQVVMGSDSDTDELEDLETLLKTSKPKAKPKPYMPPKLSASLAPELAPRKREPKNSKFSFSSLVEEQRRQTAMEVRIAAAQADVYEGSKDYELMTASPSKARVKAVLAGTVFVDDKRKATRVEEALDRTDAFERHDVWCLFDEHPNEPPTNPFPRISHRNSVLKTTLNDPERRRRAIQDGFLQRIAQKIALPDELLSWLMLEICREKSESLLSSYTATLAQAVQQTSPCLAPDMLLRCFQTLGVKHSILDDFDSPLKHTMLVVNSPTGARHQNLVPFVQLLSKVIYTLPPSSKELLAHFLIRACFDHGVRSSRLAHSSVETCLSTLLDAFSEGDELNAVLTRLSEAAFRAVQSATLRQQLVSSLPAATARTHHFRQRLALAFVLDKERHLNASLTNPALLSRMLLLFDKGSALSIRKDTDYVELRARLSMLETALDSGFNDFSFVEDNDKNAEQEFNKSIDQLTDSVRDLSAKIVDAGAAHMTRTEAKVVAERLVQKLEYVVRTKEKPLKDWFGEQDQREKRDFMKQWAGQKDLKKSSSHIESGGVFSESVKAKTGEITELPEILGSSPTTLLHDSPATLQHESPTTKVTKEASQATSGQPLSHPGDNREAASLGPLNSPVKKVVIRGGSASPMAKKGKRPLVMMRLN